MPSGSGEYSQQVGLTQEFHLDSNGVSSASPPVVTYASGGTWQRSSVVTPGYHKGLRAKKRIDLPMNPFGFECNRFSGSSGMRLLRTVNDNGSWEEHETVGYFVNNNTGFLLGKDTDVLAKLDLKARSKLLSGLKTQDVNLGVAIGESRQTVNLIADKARQIAKAGIAIKRADFIGAASALGVPPRGNSKKRSSRQNVAQNWLELQYGWKPLLADIYGGAQFLAKQHNWLARSRLRSSSTQTSTRTAVYESGLERNFDVQDDLYTVTYIVYFSEPAGGTPATALGLTNPLSVAWELVPFSFVVDWFLPLGDYFNNVDATYGLAFVKGCVTQFWRGTARRRIRGSTSYTAPNTYSLDANITLTGRGVYCNRTPLSGFPANRMPSFKSPLSGLHAANALALVAQVFSGSPDFRRTRI